MPSFYSHFYMAERASRLAQRSVAELIERNRGAFRIGAQGPDVFFYFVTSLNKKMKSCAYVGALLQNRNVGEAMALLLGAAKKDELTRAYFFGYLCHYALDCAAHPYVMAMACDACHTPFENRLETSLLEYAGQDPKKYHPISALPHGEAEAKKLDEMWAPLLKKLAPTAPDRLFLKAFRATKRGFRLLDDTKGIKTALLGRMGNPPGSPTAALHTGRNESDIDYLNAAHRAWSPVWDGKPHTESFIDLIDIAVNDACGMFDAAYTAWMTGEPAPALARIGAKDFGTALEGGQPSELEPKTCIYGEKCIARNRK